MDHSGLFSPQELVSVLSECPVISEKPNSSSPMYSHSAKWPQVPLGIATGQVYSINFWLCDRALSQKESASLSFKGLWD